MFVGPLRSTGPRPIFAFLETTLTAPDVPTSLHRDLLGHRCGRLVAPAGEMTIRGDATIEDEGKLSYRRHRRPGRRRDGLQCLNGGVRDDGWHKYDNTLRVGRIRVWRTVMRPM